MSLAGPPFDMVTLEEKVLLRNVDFRAIEIALFANFIVLLCGGSNS